MPVEISIIGAGAWGTALAVAARRAGNEVLIWAYEADVADSINIGHKTKGNPAIDLIDPGKGGSPRSTIKGVGIRSARSQHPPAAA